MGSKKTELPEAISAGSIDRIGVCRIILKHVRHALKSKGPGFVALCTIRVCAHYAYGYVRGLVEELRSRITLRRATYAMQRGNAERAIALWLTGGHDG